MKSLTEALEVCGTHIQRFIVPDLVSCAGNCLQWHEWYDFCTHSPWEHYKLPTHQKDGSKIFTIAPSTAVKMLRYCCNVTEVTLGICLNGDEVKGIVEKMKHLRKFEICHSISIPSQAIFAAAGCPKLEKFVLHCACDISHWSCDPLSDWACVGFQPPNLSIVLHVGFSTSPSLRRLLARWPKWNSQILACFKLYCGKDNFRAWDIDSVAPVVQLDFGQTAATYPFVKASNFGLFGFGKDLLVITNSTSKEQGSSNNCIR